MKEIYKDTFIYKVCEDLNINIKDLAFKMNKTLKCIENWRKDENQIPPREKEFINKDFLPRICCASTRFLYEKNILRYPQDVHFNYVLHLTP